MKITLSKEEVLSIIEAHVGEKVSGNLSAPLITAKDEEGNEDLFPFEEVLGDGVVFEVG